MLNFFLSLNPVTGDTFNPIFIIVLMALCLAGITFVLLKRSAPEQTKEENDENIEN